jgi:hypothetical protein
MVEFNELSQRRKYLLEQIVASADEIKQIDDRIAFITAKPLSMATYRK